ncbi:hypothetical protein AAE02nite_18480 [Adhaeribacter aerolatus]|uniref:DUF4123 domain-containing protein n=1 Tax=Adhaeribacter aerolatus TaxID=670289 RepID=A0A512AWW4_9BACT|nr:DUF4123 domain-containing protein [Adhaeribacter aerolatus]GEO04184.1 hypothetical protein AAE02nite_18480 [Adhaeribacter aerolatus]
MDFPIQFSYTILDAARMLERMEKAKGLNSQYASLYRGRSKEDLGVVAPYLFIYQEGTSFANWLAEEGWGDFWGIYFYSTAPSSELHLHFRKFLLVQTEEGEELYFRFYDPRVLRIFLPTCNEAQLREFFGPVSYFMMEDEDPTQAIIFYLKEGQLGSYTLPVSNVETITNKDEVAETEQ